QQRPSSSSKVSTRGSSSREARSEVSAQPASNKRRRHAGAGTSGDAQEVTMTTTRYSKYEGTLDDLDMSDLMAMLQDRLLESGFNRDPWDPDPDYTPSMEELYQAIAEALFNQDLITDEQLQNAIDSDN